MIRVNLLKAKSAAAGALEFLEAPWEATFITRREVALGALFLIAGELFLFLHLRQGESSDSVAVGAEQTFESGYIDAIIDDEAADALVESDLPTAVAEPRELEPNGPETDTRAADGEAPSQSQLEDTSADAIEPVVSKPKSSTETDAAAARPLPVAGRPLAGPSSTLSQLVVPRADEAVRIFALTGKSPEHSTFYLDRPKRVVVDLKGGQVKLPRGQAQQGIGHADVTRVRAGQFQSHPPRARLVLDVESYPEIQFLPQFNGLYLVVTGLPQ